MPTCNFFTTDVTLSLLRAAVGNHVNLHSRLFPRFFQLSAVTLALTTACAKQTIDLSSTHVVLLGVANACILLNLLYLEPKTTSVMFGIYICVCLSVCVFVRMLVSCLDCVCAL